MIPVVARVEVEDEVRRGHRPEVDAAVGEGGLDVRVSWELAQFELEIGRQREFGHVVDDRIHRRFLPGQTYGADLLLGLRNNRHGGYDFVALRDLQPGDEVTYDYETTDYVTIGVPHCKCGSAGCRGRIYGFQFLPEEVRNRYGEFIAGYLKGQPAGG